MIVNLSESAGDVMLSALAGVLKGGSIELLTDDGALLVTLQLSSPAAEVTDGELHFSKIFEGDAIRAGQPVTARILASDGEEVLSCDVGAEESDCVVKLTPATVHRGAPVRLNSFKLQMP